MHVRTCVAACCSDEFFGNGHGSAPGERHFCSSPLHFGGHALAIFMWLAVNVLDAVTPGSA